jgi:hypothetical protein
MATTERGHYRFVVKEGAEGQTSIAAEPAGDTIRQFTISEFGGGLLCFDLQSGTDLQEAQEIAKKLNQWIPSISLTTFGPNE